MKRILLATTALMTISYGTAIAQNAPPARDAAPRAPTTQAPATQAPAERTSTMRENEFTANNLVGMRVYAPKPGDVAEVPRTTGTTSPAAGTAPAPANRNDAARAAAPRVELPSATPGGRPAAVSDDQWKAMTDRFDNIGEVNDLVLSGDGRIHQVVLGVGGFLGIGEKNVAIAWSDLRLMRGSDGDLFAVVTRTKEQLQSMPTFEAERRN